MGWLGWAVLVLVGLNIVFFGVLYVVSEFNDRRDKK